MNSHHNNDEDDNGDDNRNDNSNVNLPWRLLKCPPVHTHGDQFPVKCVLPFTEPKHDDVAKIKVG